MLMALNAWFSFKTVRLAFAGTVLAIATLSGAQVHAQGLSRDQLMTAIWPKKPVQPNTLDQHKGRTNDILECLRLEIRADNRGIWTLTEM